MATTNTSNFWDGDFYFDTIHSSTYKVCIIDFGLKDKLKEIGINFKLGLTAEKSYDGNSMYIESNKETDNVTIQLARTDALPWNTTDLLAINKWLFKKNFKKFQTMDFSSDGYNIVLYLKAINFSKHLTPDLYGYIEIEFQTFDSYSYIIPPNNFTLTNGETKTLSSYSNLYDNYKPILKITNNGNESTEISIGNKTTGNTLKLSGIKANETITVDCKIGSVLNANKENRFETLDSYDFIELTSGDNELSLSGNATVEVICEFPVIV